MAETVITRIGPIVDSKGQTLFVYAPLSGRVTQEAVVFTQDDAEGLSQIISVLGDVDIAVDRVLVEAGAMLGLKARELSVGEAVLASEIALGLHKLSGVPSTTNAAWRRGFFEQLGAAWFAPAINLLTEGIVAQGEVSGQTGGRKIRIGVTCAFRPDPDPTVLFSLAGTGDEAKADVDLALMEEPYYLRDQLSGAYNVDAVPRIAVSDGFVDTAWCDNWLPVITTVLAALSAIPTDKTSGEATLAECKGGPLHAKMSFLQNVNLL